MQLMDLRVGARRHARLADMQLATGTCILRGIRSDARGPITGNGGYRDPASNLQREPVPYLYR